MTLLLIETGCKNSIIDYTGSSESVCDVHKVQMDTALLKAQCGESGVSMYPEDSKGRTYEQARSALFPNYWDEPVLIGLCLTPERQGVSEAKVRMCLECQKARNNWIEHAKNSHVSEG